MFRKILSLMRNSVIIKSGKSSSTRIISYIISAIILVFCFIFIGIEISTAITSLYNTGKYYISSEIIVIFASLLAHQLTLLGINKNAETTQHRTEVQNENEKNN